MREGDIYDLFEIIKNTRGIITYILKHSDDKFSDKFLNFISTELKNEFKIFNIGSYDMENIHKIVNEITEKTILCVDISFSKNINNVIQHIPYNKNVIIFIKKYSYAAITSTSPYTTIPSQLLYRSSIILSLNSNILKLDKMRVLHDFDYIDLNNLNKMVRKKKLEKLSNLTSLY